MARVMDGQSIALYDAAVAAGAATTFDLSGLSGGGNVVTVSNKTGGACRMTVNTTSGGVAADPADDTVGNVAFFLDGDNAVFTYGSTADITSVKIWPITDSWTICHVTVHRDQ